jgi:hypothetical protein
MSTIAVGLPTQDVEVVIAQRMLDDGKVLDLNDRASFQNAIERRKAEIVTGLADPTAKYWTRKLQKEVEPLLRMRFCPRFGYVIDRWIADEGFWHQIPGTIGFQPPKPGLCERMRNQYDMWKQSSPKEDEDAIANRARHPILKKKDEESAKVRESNEKASTEKVLAAVDSLSAKQIENFVAVERARHTGEKLIHHGPDLKFVEHVEELQKTTPAPPEDMGKYCANPGMNPKLLKRKTGGKHIRE